MNKDDILNALRVAYARSLVEQTDPAEGFGGREAIQFVWEALFDRSAKGPDYQDWDFEVPHGIKDEHFGQVQLHYQVRVKPLGFFKESWIDEMIQRCNDEARDWKEYQEKA